MTGFASPWHIIIFALVVLLVFGTKRLPEIGRSMGTGMREFKHSITAREEEEPAGRAALPPGTSSDPSREHDSIG